MKKTRLILKITLCLTVVFGIHATVRAASAIATVGPNTANPNVFYSGACNGTFDLATNDAFIRSKVGFGINLNVAVEFTQMVGNCASYQLHASGIWHLMLGAANGGPTTFRVIDNVNGNVLLRGQFRRAILYGRSGSSSLAVTLPVDNVLYDGASLWFPAGDPLDMGSFAIAILAQNPVFAAQDNGPQAFDANGDINLGEQ